MSQTAEDAQPIVLNAPEGDGERHYSPVRGTRRRPLLMFVPNQGEIDRYLPVADIRLIDVEKDGSAAYVEFSFMRVVMTGSLLRQVTDAIAAGIGWRIEAFDPERHDPPETSPTGIDTAVIRTMDFQVPKPPEKRPAAEPESAARH